MRHLDKHGLGPEYGLKGWGRQGIACHSRNVGFMPMGGEAVYPVAHGFMSWKAKGNIVIHPRFLSAPPFDLQQKCFEVEHSC